MTESEMRKIMRVVNTASNPIDAQHMAIRLAGIWPEFYGLIRAVLWNKFEWLDFPSPEVVRQAYASTMKGIANASR